MEQMKPLSYHLYGENVTHPVLKPLKCFTADQAACLDATDGVENVELFSKVSNDGDASIHEDMQTSALNFLPVHCRPPSLLGFIPSALKDAEPLVSASEGNLPGSTSRTSSVLFVLMLVSLRLLLMLLAVTTPEVAKEVDIEMEQLWKALILLYQKGLPIENKRNLRYTASEGRLKLTRESDSYRLLGDTLFNGYQKKEDIATSGGYSVVIDNLNCPHLRVQFPMSRIKEFFDIPLKGTQSLSMIFCAT